MVYLRLKPIGPISPSSHEVDSEPNSESPKLSNENSPLPVPAARLKLNGEVSVQPGIASKAYSPVANSGRLPSSSGAPVGCTVPRPSKSTIVPATAGTASHAASTADNHAVNVLFRLQLICSPLSGWL